MLEAFVFLGDFVPSWQNVFSLYPIFSSIRSNSSAE